jgi:pyruvate kinase
VPSLTEKDDIDLEFVLRAGVDAVAVSFVRTAEDIHLVRERVTHYGGSTWIVAKLEKPQAIEHLEGILQAADGIMVARGDLGVEVPPEKVPAIQKHIIRRAADYRKPVITATQMLESMIDNPRPTRAEVSDVANAIYDGSDAVMLSGESAMGAYPVAAVSMMAKIVAEAEHNIAAAKHETPLSARPRHKTLSVAETICEATAHAAEDLDLRGIAIFTETGATAIKLSKYQPAAPIYAFSSVDVTINRLNLLWGVTPIRCSKVQTTEAMVELAETLLEQFGYVARGQIIALIAGTGTKSGSTNFLRLHKLGDRIHRLVDAPVAATVGV